jgi:hypothetical protein
MAPATIWLERRDHFCAWFAFVLPRDRHPESAEVVIGERSAIETRGAEPGEIREHRVRLLRGDDRPIDALVGGALHERVPFVFFRIDLQP